MAHRRLRIPLAASLFLLTLAAASGPQAAGQASKPAAQPKPEEKPEGASSLGPEYDEEVTRTREELENIQVWLNAKRAQLKAAEFSSQLQSKIQGDYDRLLKKGMSTPRIREIVDLEFLESESQRALLLAEIGDLQSRYNRTKRYLTRLERNGTSAMKSPEDRSLELTEVLTRLKYAERLILKLQEELKDTKADLYKNKPY